MGFCRVPWRVRPVCHRKEIITAIRGWHTLRSRLLAAWRPHAVDVGQKYESVVVSGGVTGAGILADPETGTESKSVRLMFLCSPRHGSQHVKSVL
jgi:hypothetical protein